MNTPAKAATTASPATVAPAAAKKPTTFKRVEAAYPAEMRVQLWPLCCGASIISGFKAVGNLGPEELVQQIDDTLKAVPDLQVYASEQIKPELTFLTLNGGQMASKAIRQAIERAGFVQFGQSTPRNADQGFFYRDPRGVFKLTAPTGEVVDLKAACGC